MTWRFRIPVTESLPTGNSRLHHMARAKITSRIRAEAGLVARAERNAQGVPVCTEKRTVGLTLNRGPRQRELDWDQLYASLKPILDALVDAAWLCDDAPRWCDYTARQTTDRAAGAYVEVEVSE